MSDKPSYLGLLNALSLAESAAHDYLECWIATTPRDDVRGILQAVSVREGEHGKAFAKRINELGYTLKTKDDPNAGKTMELAARRDLTDLEKFEAFKLGRPEPEGPDVFARFFEDPTIDIRTGELLGRYICEERDSGRLLRSCYEQLKAEASGGTTSAGSDDRLCALEAKVDQLCAAVDALVASSNGKAAKEKVSA
ncbi:MAG TPA: hypothetical protein VEA78_07895 [Acidimicrobiales bacterium]|nr:hypothetical protein [Acidimicrobiales bacterium]